MIRIKFDSKAIDTLEYERYHHPDPKTLKKMETLLTWNFQSFEKVKISTV